MPHICEEELTTLAQETYIKGMDLKLKWHVLIPTFKGEASFLIGRMKEQYEKLPRKRNMRSSARMSWLRTTLKQPAIAGEEGWDTDGNCHDCDPF